MIFLNFPSLPLPPFPPGIHHIKLHNLICLVSRAPMLEKLFCAQWKLRNQGRLESVTAPTQPRFPGLVFHSSSQLMADISKLFIKLCYFITGVIREYSELEGTHQLSCCSKSKGTLHSLIGILMCLQAAFLSPSLWIEIGLYFIFEAAKGRLCMGILEGISNELEMGSLSF